MGQIHSGISGDGTSSSGSTTDFATATFLQGTDNLTGAKAPLDTTVYNSDAASIVLEADGSVTVGTGRWMILGRATRNGSNTSQFDIMLDGVVVGNLLEVDGPTIPSTGFAVVDVTAATGSIHIEEFGGASITWNGGANDAYASRITVTQLPQSNEAGAAAAATETTSTLVDNGDDTYTYTDEVGAITIISSSSADLLTDADGDTTISVEAAADNDNIIMRIGNAGDSDLQAITEVMRFGVGGVVIDTPSGAANSANGVEMSISTGDGDSNGDGGAFNLNSGSTTGGTGGELNIYAGNSDSGTGGTTTISGGESTSSGGGGLDLLGGLGATSGGGITISAGDGGSSAGGTLIAKAGDSEGTNGAKSEIHGGAATGAGDNGGASSLFGGDSATADGGAIGLAGGVGAIDGGSILVRGGAGGTGDDGKLVLYPSTNGNQTPLSFGDPETENFTSFVRPAVQTVDVEYTLPDADGTVGQSLATDGAGTLSWATISGSAPVDLDGDTKIEVEATADDDTIRLTAGNRGLSQHTAHEVANFTVDGITLSTAASISGDNTSGDIELITGDTEGTGAAGDVILVGGDSVNGDAGQIRLNGGDATTNGLGGDIYASAGDANTSGGGNLFFNSGSSVDGSGGNGNLSGGNSTNGDGGDVGITGGIGATSGGDINLKPGSGIVDGQVIITSRNVNTGGTLAFSEASVNGTNKITLSAPDSLAADTDYILPDADGTSGQVLSTDGLGAMSWEDSTGTLLSSIHLGVSVTTSSLRCPFDTVIYAKEIASFSVAVDGTITFNTAGIFRIDVNCGFASIDQDWTVSHNGTVIRTFADASISNREKPIVIDVVATDTITCDTAIAAQWYGGATSSDTDKDFSTILITQMSDTTQVLPTLATLIDDDTMATASDTSVATSESIVARYESHTVVEDATGTLTQLTGTAWSINDTTNPGDNSYNLITSKTYYHQIANLRYYHVAFHNDNDAAITFEVNGAVDVMQVAGIGNTKDNTSAQAFLIKRDGVNIISLDRNDAANDDSVLSITFIAIMS